MMKLATFDAGNENRAGLVIGERVVDLAAATKALGIEPCEPETVLGILDSGEACWQKVAENAEAVLADEALWSLELCGGHRAVHNLSEVRLKAPIQVPRKILCLAGNYEEHIREGGGKVTTDTKVTPRVFMKPPSTTLTDPGAPIVIPKVGQSIDWEAELGVVIGKRAKYVTPEQAEDCVFGYTIVNDVSERELLIRERDESKQWDRFFDWLNGKWCDSFAPMGPWVVSKDSIPDAADLRIVLRLNGEVKQDGNTGQMIFPPAEIISYISQIVTLEPGDVIATGTPAGVGHAAGIRLQPGDVVEIEIDHIGTLSNPVVADEK